MEEALIYIVLYAVFGCLFLIGTVSYFVFGFKVGPAEIASKAVSETKS